MSRLLIDTNIVIDLLAERIEFYSEAAILFSRGDKNKVELTTSALTFANTNYILSKQLGAAKAKKVLQKFKVLVAVLALNDKITQLALGDDAFKDFEDGLQYYTALENDVDVIITRNKGDFRSSRIPVLSAKEFLAR
ncbi:MAG: PIN domain-containing protein [Cyclobacteriaceae bacterium]